MTDPQRENNNTSGSANNANQHKPRNNNNYIKNNNNDGESKYLHKKFKKIATIQTPSPVIQKLLPIVDNTVESHDEVDGNVLAKNLESSPEATDSEGKKKIHRCAYCNIVCAKPSVLRKHIRVHTNKRPYPCLPCGSAFKTKSNFYKHCRSRTHSNRATNNNDIKKASEDSDNSLSDSTSNGTVDEISPPPPPPPSQSATIPMKTVKTDKIYKPKFHMALQSANDGETSRPNAEQVSEHIDKIVADNQAVVGRTALNISMPRNNQNMSRVDAEPLNLSGDEGPHARQQDESIIKDLLLKKTDNFICPMCQSSLPTADHLENHRRYYCRGPPGAPYKEGFQLDVNRQQDVEREIFRVAPPLPSPGPLLGTTRLVDPHGPSPAKRIRIDSTIRSLEEISKYPRPYSMQMFGGEVKIMDNRGPPKTMRIELHQPATSPDKCMTTESPIVVRSGLHSGGTMVHKPEGHPPTTMMSLPNISAPMAPTVPYNYLDPISPLRSITAYNPLTLPAGMTTIFHGGKIIPYVPGMPGPQTVPEMSSQLALKPSYNVVPSLHIVPSRPMDLISPVREVPCVPGIPGPTSCAPSLPPLGPVREIIPSPKVPAKLEEKLRRSSEPKDRMQAARKEMPSHGDRPQKTTELRKRPGSWDDDYRIDNCRASPMEIISIPVINDRPMAKVTANEPQTTVSELKKPVNKFLRPNSLSLKPGTFSTKSHHGITPTANTMPLVSPETPRSEKSYGQMFLNGHAYTYLEFKCSTRTFYCALNRPQAMYVTFKAGLSMYSNWRISTEAAPDVDMTLYDSRHRPAAYTVAWRKPDDILTHSTQRPITLVNSNNGPGSDSTDKTRRIRTVNGGFESNDDYTYVRGRGRGRYVCEECGIRCRKPSMLKKHIRSHTDVRPYTCRHCTFSFKTKGNLTKHMKSKAHEKKCRELGIIPVPTVVCDDNINKDAVAQLTGAEESSDEEDDSDGEESDESGSEIHEAAQSLLRLSQPNPDWIGLISCARPSTYPYLLKCTEPEKKLSKPEERRDSVICSSIRLDNAAQEAPPVPSQPIDLTVKINTPPNDILSPADTEPVFMKILPQGPDWKPDGHMLQAYLTERHVMDSKIKQQCRVGKVDRALVENRAPCGTPTEVVEDVKPRSEIPAPGLLFKSEERLPEVTDERKDQLRHQVHDGNNAFGARKVVVDRAGIAKQTEFLQPAGLYPSASEDGRSVCSVCNKVFNKPSQLRLHINIHYFERPFRCDACAVSFRTKGHLTKHERSTSHHNKVSLTSTFGAATSNNPRPFKCTDCNSAFRIHGHLAKHLRSKMHIMKLECLGKLPFGTYAEMERSGVNLNDIDTTDCDNSLTSLQILAQKLYEKDPSKMGQWDPEMTPAASSGETSSDEGEPLSGAFTDVDMRAYHVSALEPRPGGGTGPAAYADQGRPDS